MKKVITGKNSSDSEPEKKGNVVATDRFKNLAERTTPEYFAASLIETSLTQEITGEDRKQLAEAIKKVKTSKLLPEKTKKLLEYLSLAEKGGRFSAKRTVTTTLSYLEGKTGDEQLAFEKRLMDAWCSGGIKKFAESEAKASESFRISIYEKDLLGEMIKLALTKKDIFVAVAIGNVGMYYPVSQKQEKRLLAIENVNRVLMGANL